MGGGGERRDRAPLAARAVFPSRATSQLVSRPGRHGRSRAAVFERRGNGARVSGRTGRGDRPRRVFSGDRHADHALAGSADDRGVAGGDSRAAGVRRAVLSAGAAIVRAGRCVGGAAHHAAAGEPDRHSRGAGVWPAGIRDQPLSRAQRRAARSGVSAVHRAEQLLDAIGLVGLPSAWTDTHRRRLFRAAGRDFGWHLGLLLLAGADDHLAGAADRPSAGRFGEGLGGDRSDSGDPGRAGGERRTGAGSADRRRHRGSRPDVPLPRRTAGARQFVADHPQRRGGGTARAAGRR